MKFNDNDFEVQWFSGTGPGGQHRNKTQNCCRVTHIPTGIKAQGTSSRSRESNYKNALSVCKARVIDSLKQDKERFRASDERVRTYHEPDNRVVDHASGEVRTYKKVVIDGNIEDLIEARASVIRSKEIE